MINAIGCKSRETRADISRDAEWPEGACGMGKVIDLNQARRRRARAEREKRAERNRVQFGRRKTDRDRDAVERERLQRGLDEQRLEDDD